MLAQFKSQRGPTRGPTIISFFVVNRLFMKLFKTCDINVLKVCQNLFTCELPYATLAGRARKFLDKITDSDVCYCYLMYLRALVKFSEFILVFYMCLLSLVIVNHVYSGNTDISRNSK